MNPLSRILAALGAVVVLVGAVFFGLVVLALAIGLGLLAWLAFSLRLWWLRRQMKDAAGDSGGSGRPREGQVIDADYEVVSRKEED
jgi:hypothetical protein